MQTILGAGGAIGVELAKVLPQYTDKVRLVSRNPVRINQEDELLPADLLDVQAVLKAVEGSEIVYLTAGLPYNIKVWQSQWPVLMHNVMEACKAHRSKLVFFDNLYMYDARDLNPATEESSINPPSKKGKVRATLAKDLLLASHRGELQALIARSADFYGPGIGQTSVLNEMVIKNLAKGKPAMWLGSLACRHSFTYTPDAAKATALLGNTESAYGQVWHVPTADNPPTGHQWVEMIAKELGVSPKARSFPKWMVQMMGLFVPIMKEIGEMMYQYEHDYVFESFKFQEHFNLPPTSYQEGVRSVIAEDYPGRK